MNKKMTQSIAIFIFLSLFIHLSLGTGILTLNIPSASQSMSNEVQFEILTPDPKKMEFIDRAQKQIVEQEKQFNDEVPEDTRYLSKFNQSVEKETRAAKTGEFKNTALPGAQKSGQVEEKPEKQKSVSRGELPSLKALKPQFSLTPKVRRDEAGNAGDPSQTDDYLKDTEKGIQTLLSTREFVYYSYYSRIKQQIRQYWEPTVRQKVKIIYRSGRTIAAAQDRVTQVIVILDSRGELEGVQIIGPSGVEDLDEAAIEAFRAAAPFPNPPKGMVEKDGRIRIRWDFILEASVQPDGRFGKYS